MGWYKRYCMSKKSRTPLTLSDWTETWWGCSLDPEEQLCYYGLVQSGNSKYCLIGLQSFAPPKYALNPIWLGWNLVGVFLRPRGTTLLLWMVQSGNSKYCLIGLQSFAPPKYALNPIWLGWNLVGVFLMCYFGGVDYYSSMLSEPPGDFILTKPDFST